MQQKSLINFFIRGFYLGNKNIYLFLISLFLSIPLLMNNPALGIVFIMINIGFALSIPLLLTCSQDKNLHMKQTINIVLNSVKRSAFPVMLLLFLLGIFIMLSLGILSIILNPTEEQRMELLQFMSKSSVPYIYTVVSSLLLFTAFFFSLEQNGLFTSMKKSVVASFKNLNFIILIILFQILIYYTTTLIPLEDFWKQLLDIEINSYIRLILIASSLFYYQNVIKKT